MLMNLSKHPEVVEARKRREAAEQALAKATGDMAVARTALEVVESDAAEAICNGKAPRLSSRHIAATQVSESEVRVAQMAVQRAQEAEREALEAAGAEIRAQMQSDYAKAVEKLDKALSAAANANKAVLEIYQQATFAFGYRRGIEALFWPELLAEPLVDHSRYAHWRRSANLM